LFLHAIILLYAVTSICSKIAASLEFFSPKWILIYGLQIVILGVYAILWQQVLKRMNLNFAYANKSLTLVWGMLFGILFFEETLTVWNIIGAIIVLGGVILMVTGEEGEQPEGAAQALESEEGGNE